MCFCFSLFIISIKEAIVVDLPELVAPVIKTIPLLYFVKTSNDMAPEVAIGWRERKLNGKYEFKWLFVGKFAEGISDEANTKEGKLSPTTKSIKGSFYERSLDNQYEISVDESNLIDEYTDAKTALANWFSAVQEYPNAADNTGGGDGGETGDNVGDGSVTE